MSELKFTKNWEKKLEAKLLEFYSDSNWNEIGKTYICSPLGAKTIKEINKNMEKAKEYMYLATMIFDCPCVAPHAYLPLLLNDTNPNERNIGLSFGIQLLDQCDTIFVCGNRLSPGMVEEIKYAEKNNKNIFWFTDSLTKPIKEIAPDCINRDVKTPWFVNDKGLKCLGSACPRQYVENHKI